MELNGRVMQERIRLLNAKLEKAIEQRDHFAKLYHALARVPHQERREIMEDLDHEIVQTGQQKNVGEGS